MDDWCGIESYDPIMTTMAEPESIRARTLPLPDARGDRLPWLDGLRGVAILAVLATHLTLATSGETPSRFDRVVRGIAGPGWIGVDLFFVLSGFLITGILLDTKGGPGYFRQFYTRRALRIFPAYYAFLLAMLFLTPVMYPHAGAEYDLFRHSLGWFMTYQTNIW